MAKKLVVLEVAVQTTWVVIDTETGKVIDRQTDAGARLSEDQWDTWYPLWKRDIEALRERVEAEPPPPPNRAERRARARGRGAAVLTPVQRPAAKKG